MIENSQFHNNVVNLIMKKVITTDTLGIRKSNLSRLRLLEILNPLNILYILIFRYEESSSPELFTTSYLAKK